MGEEVTALHVETAQKSAPPVQVERSPGNINYEVTLGMLGELFKIVSRDPSADLVTYQTLEVTSALAINLQHEMVRRGLWDKVRCPNCLQEVTELTGTMGVAGPEIHWKCGTPACWASTEMQRALV